MDIGSTSEKSPTAELEESKIEPETEGTDILSEVVREAEEPTTVKATVMEMGTDDPMKLEDASVVYDEIVADSDDIMPSVSVRSNGSDVGATSTDALELPHDIDLEELQDGGSVVNITELDQIQNINGDNAVEIVDKDENSDMVPMDECADEDLDEMVDEIEAESKDENANDGDSVDSELDREIEAAQVTGVDCDSMDSAYEVMDEEVAPVIETHTRTVRKKRDDNGYDSPEDSDDYDFIGFEPDFNFENPDNILNKFLDNIIKEEILSSDGDPPKAKIKMEVKKEEEDLDDNVDMDDAEEAEDNETMVTEGSSPTVPSAPHMSVTSCTYIDPIWRRPFELGWKRELVYRAQPELSKDKGDIYYYTPCGKKLRTRNEIYVNLHDGLEPLNFTFIREPIGPGLGLTQDQETIRSAKLQVPASRRSIMDQPSTPDPTVLGKRVPKPKMPKGASPPHAMGISSPAFPSVSSGKPIGLQRSIGTRRMDAYIDADIKVTPLKGTGKITRGNSREPCTIQCVLAMGMIPLLQCRKCLCLYHHECAGIDRFDDLASAAYICKNCILETSTAAANKPPVPDSNPAPQPVAITPPVAATKNTPAAQTMTKSSNKNSGGNVIGGMTTWVAPSSNIATSRSQLSPPLPHFMPQMIAIVAGRKYVIVPKTSTLSVSPSDNGVHGSSNSGAGASSAFEGNEGSSGYQQKQSTSSACSHSVSHFTPTTGDTDELFQMRRQQMADIGVPDNKFMNNFLCHVSLGYDVMLCVFQYLKVQELLRAACVSRLWYTAANHPSLWRTLRMKNSQVNDWEGMMDALKRNKTKHLDMRKMLVSKQDENSMWKSFSLNVAKVELESIELCRCPAEVLESLFITNQGLKIITAFNIKDENLNINGLSKLTNLTELRLKGSGNLAIEGTLNELKPLRNLKHLSLTSIIRLGTQGFEVVGRFYNLVTLELGQCKELPTMFPKYVLPNLVHLERLRLEAGQDGCCTFEILTQISQTPKLTQLELVNFDIKAGFDTYLGRCTNLKRLLLIPTYISQSATTNHMVLSAVQKLRNTLDHFVWVVTLELLRVTELYMDQCDTVVKRPYRKPTSESIPVMKPVPGMIFDEDRPARDDSDEQQVEIVPLHKVEKILQERMPKVTFKILKVPFHATWRQMLNE